MTISILTLTTTAPLAGVKRRQASHRPEYRKSYMARVLAKQRAHGPTGIKAFRKLLKQYEILSQTDVAELFGVSREAIRQTENRALAKVRARFHNEYLELAH